MKCNVGKTDRIIRAIAGLAIIGLGVYFKSWLGIIGAIFVVTAIFAFCPLYLPLKMNTGGK